MKKKCIGRWTITLLIGFFSLFSFEVTAQNSVKTLELTSDFNGWYSYLGDRGKDNDPEKIFQIENSVLHISGKSFGYLATKKSYTNFLFKAEFKWGEKKFPPRENSKRDSGICYYMPLDEPDKVWPRLVEFQIQEGDCGDFWLVGGPTIIINGTRTIGQDYLQVVKTVDAERPTGEWNSIEISAKDGVLIHKINGHIVNQGNDCSERSGRILIQSEGAEIFFKSISIQDL